MIYYLAVIGVAVSCCTFVSSSSSDDSESASHECSYSCQSYWNMLVTMRSTLARPMLDQQTLPLTKIIKLITRMLIKTATIKPQVLLITIKLWRALIQLKQGEKPNLCKVPLPNSIILHKQKSHNLWVYALPGCLSRVSSCKRSHTALSSNDFSIVIIWMWLGFLWHEPLFLYQVFQV